MIDSTPVKDSDATPGVAAPTSDSVMPFRVALMFWYCPAWIGAGPTTMCVESVTEITCTWNGVSVMTLVSGLTMNGPVDGHWNTSPGLAVPLMPATVSETVSVQPEAAEPAEGAMVGVVPVVCATRD